jgi:hypothetical protein
MAFVFFAEYIVTDSNDPRYTAASVLLTALSFGLFLIIATAVRYAELNLFVRILVLFLSAGLVALRALNLRQSSRWEFSWALGIGIIITQIGASLLYLPLSPIQFGLIIFAPLYGLNDLANSLIEETPLQEAWARPSAFLFFITALAFFFK